MSGCLSFQGIKPHLMADVYFYTPSEGGRASAFPPGYFCICLLSLATPLTGWDGMMLLGDRPLEVGETRRVGFVFRCGEEAATAMRQAGKFWLWDGHVIAEVTVVEDAVVKEAA